MSLPSPSLSQPTEREHPLSAKKLPSLVGFTAGSHPTCSPSLTCWVPKNYQTHLARQEAETRRETQVSMMESKGSLPKMESLAKSSCALAQTGWKVALLKVPPEDPTQTSSSGRNSSHSYKEETSVPLLPTNPQNKPN